MAERTEMSAEMNLEPAAALGVWLRERLSRDPELRRGIELFTAFLGSCLALPAPTPIEREEIASAPTSPASGSVAQIEPAQLPTSVVEPTGTPPPVSPEMITGLISRFARVDVSPRVATPLQGVPTRSAAAFESSPRRRIDELEPISRRLELRADACLWARNRVERSARGEQPDLVALAELRQRADSLQPCYLWMIHQDAAFIPAEDWVRLEGCFRACAKAARLVIEHPDVYEADGELLRLLGETQSAILAAMSSCGARESWRDLDQQAVFEWCRDEGKARQVYNEHLSLDRLADPSAHEGRLLRVQRKAEELGRRRDIEKTRRRGLNTAEYHAGQIRDGAENREHHWRRIAEGIAEAVGAGMPPSKPELVDLLTPLADEIPDALAAARPLRDVLRFVDERLGREESSDVPRSAPSRAPTPEVLRCRELLRGTTLVLVGGVKREHASRLIEEQLELGELEWISSGEHESLSRFEPAIARAETRLVVMMIRWSSHSYEGLQEICERYGKVFVRLPGGYNPSQLAVQILEQASEQLEAAKA